MSIFSQSAKLSVAEPNNGANRFVDVYESCLLVFVLKPTIIHCLAAI